MKQKKRSGLSRIGALLLVFILAVNLVVPCFAAGGVVFDDTKTIDTGILEYDYDKIPKYMLEDNYALDALEYIGFDVQALKDNKVIYNPDYTGRHLAGKQYLLQEEPILTYIKYSDSSAHGGISKDAETLEEKAASITGKVPDINVFYNGNDTYKPGMSCTSFVEYFVFGYLKHIVGKDTRYIETMHATALKRLADGSRTYPDTWTEMCEGKGGLISQGKVRHYSIELDESKDQTKEYNAIWRKISPGTIIRFGNETSEYIHYAVYIGTYNNIHYVAHVGGGGRGPEIYIAEHMAAHNGPKSSFPIDFYDFRFVEENFGTIQVLKSDADDDTKLAGAYFKVVNQDTDEEYLIGPTNEKGYASLEDLPYDLDNGTTYTVCESIAPKGYALDPTVHTVVLNKDTPLVTLYQEITNKKEYGSLLIQKDTNTGNSKAGWQFNVYKNHPFYTMALSQDNEGQMFRVTVSDNKGFSVTSDAVSMTTTPLKILRQPSNVVAAVGEKVSYTVIAQGDGLSYQWQYKNPGEEWTTSSSTDGLSPYYSYVMRADRDGRLSRCIITDKYGNSVTTDEVFMVLPTTLAVISSPESTTTAVGQTVSMAVTASGSNVNYQWQYSTNGTTWYNCTTSNHAGCSGATTATLKFTGNTAYDGRMYRCKVTNGTKTIYSNSATSSIVAAIINTQPQTQITALGNSVTFSIGTTGSDLTYTWQGKARGSSSWTTMGSGTSYTTTLSEANEGTEIRCVISKNGKTVISDSAYLATATTLVITQQPQNHVDEEGTYATFKVNAQGVGLTYVWETSTDGGKTWTRLTNPINDEPYETDSTGKYLISKIQTGDYFVQEIDTGKDGWEYDLVAKPVTVTADHTATAPAQVNFTNNELLGSVFIDKYIEDDQCYEGWKFAIYSDAGCTNLIAGPKATDMDGFYLFEGLTPGTYWVKELGHIDPAIDELYYCASENPQMVTVKAGETAHVIFENELNRGSIEIIKEDNRTGEKLSGAIFQAVDGNGTIYTFTESTEKPGYYYLNDVLYGTYTITEIQTPDGYKSGPETKWEVKLGKDSPSKKESITIVNIEILGGVSIKKTTEDSRNLKDWIFNIYADKDCSTLISGPHYTDDGGLIHVNNLKPGTYWIKEEGNRDTSIADRYYCNSNNPQSVEVVEGDPATVTFENKLYRGFIEIIKKGDNGKFLSGAVFKAIDAYGVEYTFIESTEKLGYYYLNNIPYGTYTVAEVTPPEGYELGEQNEWVVTLDKNSDNASETLTVINTEILGDLFIKKETEDGKNLEGWIFNVYADANCSVLLDGNLKTNANGFITVHGLKPGTVWVREEGHVNPDIADLYYCNSNNPQSVEIVGHETATVTFENKLNRGSIEIIKKGDNGKLLSGAVFTVKDYNGNVFSLIESTEKIGYYYLNNIPYGTYTITEVTPPEGYELGDQTEWTVTLDKNTPNSTESITVVNKEKLGTLEIQKLTNTGNDKGGWMVNVYRGSVAEENLLPGSPFKTEHEDGKIVISDLPIGIYIAVEVDDGKEMWIYDLEEKTAEVPHNSTGYITIRNKHQGHGMIIKTTVNGGSSVGWQFKVWQEGSEPTTVTTKEGGVFDLGLLDPGTYYVQEIGHESMTADELRYWITDTEVKTLTIEAGKTASVTFENVWMGELVIDKQAINSDLLAGWTGDLYLVNADGSETKIGTYTSDEYGRFTDLLVAPGKYIFRETGHSDSSVDLTYWVMAGDKEIEVTTGTTNSATIINIQLGYGLIQKDTTNGGLKEGWLFEIRDANGNELDNSPYATDSNGYLNTDLLPNGIYTVKEIGHSSMTSEQLAYWIMDTEEKTIEIKAGHTSTVRFENKWQGMGRIKKEMPDGGSVAGWIFDVYRVSDNTYIGEFTSDANGDAVIGYLIPGDYRVVERVPEGSLYLPVGGNEKILTVVAGETKSVTFRNVLRSGEIILNKLDTSNDKALAGAKFLLEWLDGDVWKPVVFSDTVIPGGCRSEGLVNGCLVTGENGQIIFEGLHPDLEYRLTEVEAPDGYSLQSVPVFEGKLPSETLSKEVTAYNSGVIISPPTGVDDHLNELVVFTAIVVCLFITMVALAAKEGLLAEMIRGNKK